MAEVLGEECRLLVEGFSYRGRRIGELLGDTGMKAKPHLGSFRALPSFLVPRHPLMKVCEHLARRIEGAENPSLPDILEREGELTIHKALRGQRDLLSLDLGFEDVAHGELRLLTNSSRERHLIFRLDRYKRHRSTSSRHSSAKVRKYEFLNPL